MQFYVVVQCTPKTPVLPVLHSTLGPFKTLEDAISAWNDYKDLNTSADYECRAGIETEISK